MWIADCHLKERQKKSCYANKMFACGHTSLSLCLVSDHFHKITQLVTSCYFSYWAILDWTKVLLSCLSELHGCLVMEWSIDLRNVYNLVYKYAQFHFVIRDLKKKRTKFRE
jgi:hypothetical protein